MRSNILHIPRNDGEENEGNNEVRRADEELLTVEKTKKEISVKVTPENRDML